MTAPDTHDGPIKACTVTGLPHHIMMCPGHWRQVPRGLQRLVYAAWRGVGEPGGRARHLQARENAIASVEDRDPVDLFVDITRQPERPNP